MGRPKHLYIAGYSRSGSTILGQTLGAIEGWFDCGELNRAPLNRPCGCGAPVFECEVWGPILARLRAAHPELEAEALINRPGHALDGRLRGFAAVAREARRGAGDTRLGRYAKLQVDLLAEVGRTTGAGVVVDSSKAASNAHLLATLSGDDLFVVHLVRDPRAAAYSWSKKLELPRGYERVPDFMAPKGALSSGRQWLRRNALIEGFVRRRLPAERYLRLRYEDFAARPAEAVAAICSFVGEPGATPPIVGERTVRRGPSHTVGGNPVRFATGDIELRADRDWESRMPTRARRLTTLAAAPLMLRYGYPLRAAR